MGREGATRWAAWAGLVAVLLAPVAGRADALAPGVLGVTLPSRDESAASRAELAAGVARQLAENLEGRVAKPGAQLDLSSSLERAQELHLLGALDEAAQTFDVALEAGRREPHRLLEPAGFVTAHVTRAAIALARGEEAEALDLSERLLRWDPRFELGEAEGSPSLRRVFDEVAARLGPRPLLHREDLGRACREAEVLVVVRGLEGGAVEVRRIDGCRSVTTIVALEADGAEAIAGRLVGHGELLSPPAAGELEAEAPGRSGATRGLYRRGWFWVAVTSVAAGSATAFWLTRDHDTTVVPRF